MQRIVVLFLSIVIVALCVGCSKRPDEQNIKENTVEKQGRSHDPMRNWGKNTPHNPAKGYGEQE